ncbi:MAG: bifunctional diaminohydroxyphosphoribosylaminopyrimidine deaminase/5-amino-6-(5-phosphoribosylamino)uracil reductase RibD [Alphaproteobacteria bacterium]|nr:bifunctional diaminohydroxyphosphoribosylaminopyrimidine deaminase/5-amino-6-(5-phosphoribosylamino)uracil reductase RibD [Alphaproteobacteria bacterium]
MRAALALARRGLGVVWPNPSVGCVIVKDDRVVGRGWTQPGGRPHAETEALRRAGAAAKGACAYVTLEPCNHFGETPPCTSALLDAGLARVATALKDPDARTAGGGHDRLREGGIEVVTDVLGNEAAWVNAGFLSRVQSGRPLVTLKTATTLDGKIAASGGASQWITGPEARQRGHLLRATHDAIMIGVGTALADAPSLTCRLAGLEDRSPVRIVMDSKLRLPLDSVLVETAREVPTWIVTVGDAPNPDRFTDCGVDVIQVDPDSAGRPDVPATLDALGQRGLTRLLVEGGGGLAAELMRNDLIDRLVWFRSAGVMGGDGIGAIAGYGVTHPDKAALFKRVESLPVGADTMEVFVRRPSG